MKPERWCHRLPTGEYVERRGVIASALALGALAAGATAGGGIVAGKLQSNASRDAANAQVSAANKAAELESQSARETLAFQRQQAAQEQQNFTNTQLANYGQYSDRQNRIGQLGPMLGLPARVAPPPPDYLTGRQTVPGQGQTAPGGDPAVEAFVAKWRQSHAPSEGIAPLAAALQQAGLSSGRFDYGGGRLSNNEINVGGKPYKLIGGEDSPKSAYWYVPGTDDSAPGARRGSSPVVPVSALFAPPAASRANLTPALMLPRVNPYGV